jgi:two-component system, NarL family, response regulator NreC
MNKIRIFLLDDHKIVRDGIRSILELDNVFEVVGEESDPSQFLSQISSIDIDLLILDITLPKIPGFEVLREVKKLRPEIQVVMLSMHDNPEYILKSMKEGASAYLPKEIGAKELIHGLKEVKLEGVYYPSSINFNSSGQLTPSTSQKTSYLLTPKEINVLQLMAKGLSSKQIANQEGLSNRTIDTHRLNIMRKMGTSNSAETIAMALKLNIIG